MRLEPSAFGSKVALRIFASFVLAALVPIVATILLVETQVKSTLTENAQTRLAEMSRAMGTTLLDRLILADNELSSIRSDSRLAASTIFDAVQLNTGSSTLPLLNEPFELDDIPNLDSADARATLIVQNDGRTEVFVARPNDAGIAVGRIKSNYLWDTTEMLAYGTALCVFDLLLRDFLHCTDQVTDRGRSMIRGSVNEPTATIAWTDGDIDFVASQWQLFLPSRFAGAQPWTIVISQPKSIAMAPLAAFGQIFPLLIAVCIIVTLLLSAIQIRRIMLPLKRLAADTKRLSEKQFSTRFDAGGNNEFSEIGQAFNDMAERLGRQFETITAFAEIDRLILSSQSVDQVMEKVLDRVIALSPNYSVSVLILDPEQPDSGRLFSRLPGDAAGTTVARISVSYRARKWMASVAAGSSIDSAWIREHIDALPQQLSTNAAIVVPVFRSDVLRGALIAQLASRDQFADREYSRLVELTSRLAVAISAADHESELFKRAHFDTLTGLPNRQLCLDRLSQAIAQARREEHQLAVLFIDLDRFKNINDSLGHTFGDELLQETALRLSSAVRETDTVARLGGDEYVVLLPHIHGVMEVEATAEKIQQIFDRPFRIRDRECQISASIGAAIFPGHAADVDELLRKADTAMYAAKESGRSRVAFFEDEMDQIVQERLEMQHDLKLALTNRDFRLVYQPQLDIESGELVCFEALIRWHHAKRGQVPPTTFIPVLEEMGLIREVGQWVLETALADFSEWHQNGLQLPRVAVNISSRQLIGGNFAKFLASAIEAANLHGENIEVELTEHSLIENFAAANAVLDDIRKLGVRVAIDDFGTGYSSLGYLQDLHFDVLKIDRGFVKSLPNEKSSAIIDAIISVANALGKEVVAEGIDAEIQRMKLVEMGCRIGQGFLFSVPISADDVLEWSRRLDVTSVIEKLVALDDERIAG